ncbi:SDR family oxidoreductase [Pleionea mediterranea]|uniref:NAD(P)-dependent dehydrogenase (Short-subunit alcohol dehydrogenase family) n=1 Tax=Pleionea mediterranea TaxID=523701 RepID=A0A316FZW8_9GAMM|nr:SDR family oxidoreductase [Pleionea mediterranea]PWK53932.1 NAD(P)-dependent dehydrogenase (short-subunit alcohol dehydrogenase family) [Pleionea mediterranea]
MTKTALITGGAIRIGQALAATCASLGYRLVIHYNASEPSAQAFSESLKKQQIDHCLLRCDLSRPSEVTQLFDRIPDPFKPIDLLINSAAIFPEQDSLADFNNNWSSVMGINSYAPIELMRQFSEQFDGSDKNSETSTEKHHVDKQIINIIDARVRHNQQDRLVYRWSKTLLQQATKDLALSLAPNIRVNGIAPGAILPPPGKSDDHLKRLESRIPLQSTGELLHITRALTYLIEQPFVTGEILSVDGGEFL